MVGPAPSRPDVSGCQRDVHDRRTVLDAFGLMLQSARVHQDRALGRADPARRFLNRLRWNACHFGRFAQVPLAGGCRDLVETGRVLTDEVTVFKAVTQDHVQHSQQQCEIGARTQGKIQISIARDRCHARIGDDQLSAVVAAAPDVVGGDGSTFADIGADDKRALRPSESRSTESCCGRCRMQACMRYLPKPCTAGRCNRCVEFLAATRANFPSRYDFSVESDAPP